MSGGLMFDPVWTDTDKYLAALDAAEAALDHACSEVQNVALYVDVQSIIDDYAEHTSAPDKFKEFCKEDDVRHQLSLADPEDFVECAEVSEKAIQDFFESEVEDRWSEFCERA